jgi:hypothetical protein
MSMFVSMSMLLSMTVSMTVSVPMSVPTFIFIFAFCFNFKLILAFMLVIMFTFMFIQHVRTTRPCNILVQHGQAAWKWRCRWTRTCSMDMDMDMHNNIDMQYRYGRAAWHTHTARYGYTSRHGQLEWAIFLKYRSFILLDKEANTKHIFIFIFSLCIARFGFSC